MPVLRTYAAMHAASAVLTGHRVAVPRGVEPLSPG